MEVTLSNTHSQELWPATIPPGITACPCPMKGNQKPWGANPLPPEAARVSVVSKHCGLIQNPCGQNPIPLVSAFHHRVAPATVLGEPFLTIGSNRSLRSLGRAKARPLTKR